jgi:hypothetical protein
LEWLESLWFSLAAGLTLLIPGGCLLAWLPESRFETDPLATLADAAALSISIAALLSLWFYLAGVKVGAAGLYILYAAGLLLLLAAFLRRKAPGFPARLQPGKIWVWVLAVGLFVGIAAWRFYQARDLALPAWVDSVHHALIVRKIIEYQGLPPDLTPYFPAPFFYHYGFHLVAALFAFWTRQSPAEAVLWFGNVINAAVALSVYKVALTFLSVGEKLHASRRDAEVVSASDVTHGLMTLELWNKPKLVALSAALLTAFIFQMPGYYVTWGRYTLLTGLILLGPVLSTAWEAWQNPGHWGMGMKLTILIAGLCMTHYLALLFAGIFLGVLGVFALGQALRQPARRAALLRLAGWVALGALLASPWVWRVALATRESMRVQMVNPVTQDAAARQGSMEYLKYLLYLLGPRRNHILLVLAGVGMVIGLRRFNIRLLAMWALILALLSLPWGLRLGPFRPDHFAIVLFFPAAILLGNLLVEGVDALSRLVQPGALERAWFRPGIFSIVMAVLLVWGMRETQQMLNKTTLIADRSDLAALDWIQSHTPVSARFYINGVLWQGNTYRGVDGGYWLMPYTGRFSLIPPALYTLALPDYVEGVNRWARATGNISGCSTEFWGVVDEALLTHVYLHQGKGKLQPSSLENCSGLSLVYRNEEVFIYEIDSEP